jgi:hypothetical protein
MLGGLIRLREEWGLRPVGDISASSAKLCRIIHLESGVFTAAICQVSISQMRVGASMLNNNGLNSFSTVVVIVLRDGATRDASNAVQHQEWRPSYKLFT